MAVKIFYGVLKFYVVVGGNSQAELFTEFALYWRYKCRWVTVIYFRIC